MVGLPARGKSFISQKSKYIESIKTFMWSIILTIFKSVVRYLSWLSIKAKSFNVGSYRRQNHKHPDAEFFDIRNKEGWQKRQEAAEQAVTDMMNWFSDEQGVVAILDATNATRERRDWILRLCRENSIEPMFLESWCDDEKIIKKNILDVKATSPDYEGLNQEDAYEDFLKRIAKYEENYEPLDEIASKDLTFVKLINVSQQVIINKIETYLESRIVYYVMNLHIKPRCIYLSRHGESMYNLEGKIGGNADLSERGFQYAKKLPELVKQLAGDDHQKLTVWTSTLVRTQQTAEHLPYNQLQWKALDELDAGACDGLTYEEIERKFPDDFKQRDENKYEYRYRGGESYRDVVIRLEPIIMELERQENILIITHQAVLRCIYAYFMNVPQEESPWMSIPLHTLIKLEPRAYSTLVQRLKADIPAVSTYKERGTSRLGEIEDANNKSKHLITGEPVSADHPLAIK
ncbi:6-phosphofructo-2-kinase/fructose-2,6-biphosphatase [Wickerhamomyces ciferrii]|uniref:fructose-2,6-bisphosphate 2-phosphatase n=1 Tax=Wickerhamomyces ciferrii (strain ATCC 14091 / BCRC 22168 / CBS 111 / JCM 3599 / NBRC 0793 / NRRL Y-1031 F-60-10) TaxID=1206466 RepID=K0KV27_WICCF|nr:6-phosphofructo-2-kinase/fructose-2,6-biphosphatase [Wickerhamomyces ciferrii]CCH45023.1 6-phosphofructo-2-kinase/fructose-2,6-biphosphatase [Wickerhamomyces ciferrii]